MCIPVIGDDVAQDERQAACNELKMHEANQVKEDWMNDLVTTGTAVALKCEMSGKPEAIFMAFCI